VDLLVGRDEVVVRGEERVLHSVLGLLEAREHVPAEREDRAMVAVVDGLEGGGLALANELHQVGVRGNAKKAW
jgi:hypothetical protein